MLTTLEPGQHIPASLAEQVSGLFAASYHRYHYETQLSGRNRFRFLVIQDGAVVGYASAAVVGHYALLANLLVHRDSRGSGLGRALERVRYDRMRALGLTCYGSATCENGASQKLKLGLAISLLTSANPTLN